MKIVAADNLAGAGLEILRDAFGAGVVACGKLEGEALHDVMRTADALIVRSATTVDAEAFKHVGKLQLIGRAGVGVDNIALEAATKAGVIVMNTPFGNYVSAAEQAIALLFAAARNVAWADRLMKQGKWEKKALVGVELMGKTLGLIGFGKVGGHVAKVCNAVGMTVLAYDPFLSPEHAQKAGVKLAELDEVLVESDFISLHCPLTEQTRGLINTAALAKMKKGAYIVNCARGGIIDEAALAEAVKSGQIAGAGVDVFEKEPVTEGPLFGIDRITLTPHLGASTVEAQDRVGVDVAKQFVAYFQEKRIENAVNVTHSSDPTLQPYVEVCRVLGKLAGQLISEPVTKLEVALFGDLSSKPNAELTSAAVQGLLSNSCQETVNIVNAAFMAKSRGIAVASSSRGEECTYRNEVAVSVSGKGVAVCVAGTVFDGKEPRIIAINDFKTEIKPSAHLLMLFYPDRPGKIGVIGTVLGKHGINIGDMEMGRDKPHGEAVVVCTLDTPASAAVQEELRKSADIRKVVAINL